MKARKAMIWILILLLIVIAGYFVYTRVIHKPMAYFRSFNINGKNEIVGIYPLKASMGKESTCYHFIYGKKGILSEVESLQNGKLSNASLFGERVARVKVEYADDSVSYSYFDIYGNPSANDSGVYKTVITLNKDKVPVSETNFDKQNEPAMDSFGVIRYEWTADKEGRKETCLRYAETKDPIIDEMGNYQTRWKYDQAGNMVEATNYGKDGKLLADSVGICVTKYAYNKEGKNEERSFYGVDGKRVQDEVGIAIYRYKHDATGSLIETAFFGTDDKRKTKDESKVAMIKGEYDKHGNAILLSSYGVDEKPVIDTHTNAAVTKLTYDADGNRIETESLGIDGKTRVASADSICITRIKYDVHRNPIEKSLFGTSDKPITDTLSVSIYRYAYNELGLIAEESYFDAQGKPTFYDNGYVKTAKTINLYDNEERLIERNLYDTEGKLYNGLLGLISTVQYQYTDKDSEPRSRLLNKDKQILMDQWKPAPTPATQAKAS